VLYGAEAGLMGQIRVTLQNKLCIVRPKFEIHERMAQVR